MCIVCVCVCARACVWYVYVLVLCFLGSFLIVFYLTKLIVIDKKVIIYYR